MSTRPDSPPVAAIDVGTNTFLLLVARRDAGGAMEVVLDRCEMPRLGAGLAGRGALAEEAVERGLAVLEDFARELERLDVPPARRRAVGTAVLRRAADASAFVAHVRERTGLALEVLPEEDEARLGHLAVVGEGGDAATLVVDVGGGSTELVGEGGRLRLSAPVGAVVLTETFLGAPEGPPLEPGGWPALRARVARACERFPADLARDAGAVVCLGGSASNLACLDRGLARFDAAAAEGWELAPEAAAAQAERLAALPLAPRLALPIEAERAAILPAGLACIAGALARIGARRARVSGRGLRYGVARELLGSGAGPR